MRYLFAAEADKIQDLIFRSSRLREVVGGSQLLLRFCREVPAYLLQQPRYNGNSKEDIIISDGGSFRIIFSDKEKLYQFGSELAEIYHRVTGGTLTVAEPVEIYGLLGKANTEADKKLRLAKGRLEGWQSEVHMPYIALCESCGTGLAVSYYSLYDDELPQYFCTYCEYKRAESTLLQKPDNFLTTFYQTVAGEDGIENYSWPGKADGKGMPGKDQNPQEEVADYNNHGKGYVAYLLADGNAMGKVFASCVTEKQMRDLSKELTKVIIKALAEPTKKIMEFNKDGQHFIPVLPLIMGGDDLFALIPAPWALDFTRIFCRTFEREMQLLLNHRIKLKVDVHPTVSAAVVICKSKYPYKRAHRIGEEHLKEAKSFYRSVLYGKKEAVSVVNFEVVLGGKIGSVHNKGAFRSTLRPYFVEEKNNLLDWGISIEEIIKQRYKLEGLPHRRLSALKRLYEDYMHPESLQPKKLEPWKKQLKDLQNRVEENLEKHGKALKNALEKLGGDENGGYWRRIYRYPEDIWYGHGLPDLLETWNFAFALDKNIGE